MNREMKDSVIFMAASLIDLADITETDLREVVEMVGVDSIRELMETGNLRYEMTCEETAGEICTLIGWEPALVPPCRTDRELSRMGHQIADLVEDAFPAYEDTAECLFAVLTWCGIGAWLAVNAERRTGNERATI